MFALSRPGSRMGERVRASVQRLYAPAFRVSLFLFFGALLSGFGYTVLRDGRLPDISLNYLSEADRSLARGNYVQAYQKYRVATRIAPDDDQALLRYSLAARAAGVPDEAKRVLRALLRLEPRHAGAHYLVGLVYLEEGELDRAIAHSRAALRLRPAFAEAHYNLATALVRKGEREAAIEHYRRALEIQPGFTPALQALQALQVASRRPAGGG